jgi:flagellar motor switch protein FliM
VTDNATISEAAQVPDGAPAGASPQVQLYNFAHAPQLSREHRVALEAVFTRLTLSLQDLLSSLLRIPLDVSLDGLEHVAFGEFRKALSTPCATFVFDTGHGVGGEGIVDVTTGVGFYIVDRLFGGPGEAPHQERSLSDLEQSVVRGVAERLLALLRDSWKEHLELAPEIVRFESNPENLRADSRVQTVIVSEMAIRAGESFSGQLAICLPLLILESFLQERVADRPARTKKSGRTSRHREHIAEDLKLAHVSLAARLAPLSLSARSLADLAPGQVIQTNQHIDLPIELHVNGRCRYLGTLGQVRRHVGLQITATIANTSGKGKLRTTRGRIL